MLVALQTIGMFTSSCQKILVFRSKDNVTLSIGLISLELSIVTTGMLFIFSYTSDVTNNLLSTVCGPLINLSQEQMNTADKAFSLMNATDGQLDFKLVVSALITQMVFMSIIMLQRT